MKTVILITLFSLSLIFNSSASFSQVPEGTEQIVVRIFEEKASNSYILISYGNGKTEKVELDFFWHKHQEKNLETINNTLNQIRKSGFSLISSGFAQNGPYASFVTNYLYLRDDLLPKNQ